jgi:hypothetical protein
VTSEINLEERVCMTGASVVKIEKSFFFAECRKDRASKMNDFSAM